MARITEHSELLLVRSQEAKDKQYSWKGCSLENAMVSQDELSLGCQVVTQVLTDLTCFSSVSSYSVTPRDPSLSVPHSLATEPVPWLFLLPDFPVVATSLSFRSQLLYHMLNEIFPNGQNDLPICPGPQSTSCSMLYYSLSVLEMTLFL